jgi:hypothetical protein
MSGSHRWQHRRPPISVSIETGGQPHTISWRAGRLHDHDLAAEEVLLALGGEPCPCLLVRDVIRTRLVPPSLPYQLSRLAVRGGASALYAQISPYDSPTRAAMLQAQVAALKARRAAMSRRSRRPMRSACCAASPASLAFAICTRGPASA